MLNSDTGLPEVVGSPPSTITWTPLSNTPGISPLAASASPPGGSPPGSLPQSPYRNFIKPNAFSSPVSSVRLLPAFPTLTLTLNLDPSIQTLTST